MADDHDSPQPSLDVLEILRRRGALLAWVAAVVMLIGVAVAYRSTPLYASRGVLLAELPSVSESAVRMVESRPGERVRIITQRVITNDNLQEIIAKNGLYPELADMPAEARGRFRDRRHLKLSAEDPQILENLLGTTRPEGALAFSVSFSHESPRVARDVANDLVALYLEENREVRREQAAETIRFLTQEARRLETEIAAREGRLVGVQDGECRSAAGSRRQQSADAGSRRPRPRRRRARDPRAARAARYLELGAHAAEPERHRSERSRRTGPVALRPPQDAAARVLSAELHL